MTKQVVQNAKRLLALYASDNIPNDEMWEIDKVKPHWQSLVAYIQKWGKQGLSQRHEDINRVLRENGVSYNIYDDPQGMNRPWQLDPIPLLIDEEDWKITEKGLKQRAELLNIILKDIYENQVLIKEGLLPLELVYNHIGFLRPCFNLLKSQTYPLSFYAADTAKTADGRRWVLGDRTQAPSGIGYALENRSTISKVMPEFFQNRHISKLSNFLDTLRTMLFELAPHHKENPRIVLLTPGQRNEAYFEHAYLASVMGYTLVQGEDLMVKDEAVWLKTLSGLEQVDVIWRRVDDAFCDPLTLRSDSHLGVAGLVAAVRKGNVVIVNALGSSVLENSGIMAFLPNICRFYFGEELLLPSVATWWCGQEKEQKYVLDNLQNLVIKSIYPQGSTNAIFGKQLSQEALAHWKEKIKANPSLYLAQEQLEFISTPSYFNGQLEPRHAVWRCFLLGKENQGYTVMSGGLTRSASERDNLIVSNQKGGISKDTWVVTSEAVPHIAPIKAQIHHLNTTISSRSAENLFWVGRYAERAKLSARLLKIVIQKYNETQLSKRKSDKKLLYDLLCGLTQFTMTYPGFIGDGGRKRLQKPESELLAIAIDTSKSGSIASIVQYMMRAVYSIRHCWSPDTWRILDQIDDYWKMINQLPAIDLRNVQIGLDQLITNLAAFAGFNKEILNRRYELPLFELGKRIEYALLSISLSRSTLTLVEAMEVENGLMEVVLACQESLNTYRAKYQSYLHLQTALDLLLLDNMHPSSLLYQLHSIQNHLKNLPKPHHFSRLNEEEKMILEAVSILQLSDTNELAEHQSASFIRQKLEDILSKIADLLAGTSNIIVNKYFSHTQMQQQLSGGLQSKDLII
jgi:uncharacterized circularly permuted ATP-grasp superfamily protein/uncharacterized alpha-E superfamily protein